MIDIDPRYAELRTIYLDPQMDDFIKEYGEFNNMTRSAVVERFLRLGMGMPVSPLPGPRKAKKLTIEQKWCEQHDHMLECLSPIDIVNAWEEYRAREHPAMTLEQAKAIVKEHERQVRLDTFD